MAGAVLCFLVPRLDVERASPASMGESGGDRRLPTEVSADRAVPPADTTQRPPTVPLGPWGERRLRFVSACEAGEHPPQILSPLTGDFEDLGFTPEGYVNVWWSDCVQCTGRLTLAPFPEVEWLTCGLVGSRPRAVFDDADIVAMNRRFYELVDVDLW